MLMDMDFTQASAPPSGMEDIELNVPTLMEDEPESVDFEELNILALEEAFNQKEYINIKPHQIDNLEVVLSHAQQRNSLGIQAGGPWDGRKIMKE